MDRSASKGKDGRAWHKDGAIYRDALQQPSLHDAVLHPALRFCFENPLHPPPHLLHRPPSVCASHPHIRVYRSDANRARNNRAQPDGSRYDHGFDYRAPLDHVCSPNFLIDPSRLSPGLVHQHFQIPFWRICVSDRPGTCARRDVFHHSRITMKRNIRGRARHSVRAILTLGLALFPASIYADRHIAFERNDAIYIANLDGTGEKKIADGIFPAISPDGTRVAFNTVEKTSETTYVRHMAVVEVATGKMNVFKDVPSENSYYPSWTADGKQILFTTRPHEVWDLVTVNSDGTNLHVL